MRIDKEKQQKEPQINKNAPKNNMVFEYISIAILILFLVYVLGDVTGCWVDLENWILTKTGSISSESITQQSSNGRSLSSIASAVIALYALVWQLRMAIQAKKVLVELELSTCVDDKRVKISCSLKNTGTKTIYPNQTNLYIIEGVPFKDMGVVDAPTLYKFEPITDHRQDRITGECFDCRLADYCKSTTLPSSGEVSFPDERYAGFETTLRFCCNFRQLSYYTLEHIMPGEKFRQDIMLEFTKSGIYQAIVLYTGKGWDDCICTSSIFTIQQSKNEVGK